MKSRIASLLALAAWLGPAPADFLEDFRQAMAAKDEARMTALVTAAQDEAVKVTVAECEGLLERTGEEREALLAALRKAWKAAFATDFVRQQYEYYSLMSPGTKKGWLELRQRYGVEAERYDKALAERTYRDLPAIGYEMESYGKAFAELGDLYHASQSWITSAWCFEEEYLKDEANLEASYVAFEQGIRLREEVGLRDAALERATERLEVLEGAGVGDEGEFTGTLAGKARREAELASAVTVDMTFALVENLESPQRPYYCADEAYQMWPAVSLGAVEAKERFPYFDGPRVVRTAYAEAKVDADADGEGDVAIPLTGSAESVTFTAGSGEQAVPWGFLARIGLERDRYQGFDMNMVSDERQLQIFTAPAGSLKGEVQGVALQVFDDNMDGVYGSAVKNWASIGCLPTGSGQADMDALRVGNEKAARPWSPVAHLGGAWYQLAIEGTKLTATPISDVETGKIALDFAGLTPDYLVVQGVTRYGDAFFDLTGPEAKKGLEVPVGTYYLITGRVSKGKREQIAKALIVPPEKARSYEVTAGQTVKVELGAPFGFEFSVRQSDEKVTVVGDSVVVSGRGGETYQRLWNCVVTPEASVRKAGSKKGGKAEEMRTATAQEDINAADGDYAVAWFPWDTDLPKKKGEEAEVQLSMKKHKLFGKIESEWRK